MCKRPSKRSSDIKKDTEVTAQKHNLAADHIDEAEKKNRS
jgi:hypothetical protein